MNSKHLDYAIKNTLYYIGKRDPALIRLIKMTMLFESDLQDFFSDPANNEYVAGYSQIRQRDLKEFLYDYVELRDIRSKMEDFCLVSFRKNSLEQIWNKIQYDLALQIVITFGIYDSRFSEVPENDLESIFECYRRNWSRKQDYTEREKEDYLEYYRDTFIYNK